MSKLRAIQVELYNVYGGDVKTGFEMILLGKWSARLQVEGVIAEHDRPLVHRVVRSRFHDAVFLDEDDDDAYANLFNFEGRK